MNQTSSVRLSAAILAALGAWTAYTQNTPSQPLGVKQLAEDLYLIEGTSNGASDAGNIAVYVTSQGVILVDDRFSQDYPEVMTAVKKISTLPVKYVINTHHHRDHTGGNAEFLLNTEIIIQANARKHMIQTDMPGPPRITFSQESSVFLGGKEVRAIYYGRGHTDGDIAVYFPALRAVHLGDLMAATRGVTNPLIDYSAGGSIASWPATLDGVLKLDVDIVIPGHGAVTNRAGLVAHRNKVEAIRARVSGLIQKNKSRDDISKALLSEFDFKPINMRSLDGMLAELKN
jgi:glyoxylase-like metal-dependent hydrolase (beta-lactamase superfamily II)